MARHLYPFLPRLGLRLSLDNLGHVRLVRCPVLLLHGTADRLAPTAMGMAVAAAAASPVEVVLIHGAGHNDTYDVGGRERSEERRVGKECRGRGARNHEKKKRAMRR